MTSPLFTENRIMTDDTMILAEHLSYAYPDGDDDVTNDVDAVHDLSVTVEKGKFTAVIGHNGSGKSTLAKLLAAVLAPKEGKVTVFCAGNENGVTPTDDETTLTVRKAVGMVFQNPDNQLVATIVEDDVAFAPENLGIDPKEIRRRVDEALETVGLAEYAEHDTHKLSGGQKQRVAIAGMLAMHPECLIFDESTAMLDPKGRADILQTILKLRDKGITVVLITHYMNEAALADTVTVVDHGRVVTSGTPEDVFDDEATLAACALEAPQAAMLVQKLKKAGIPVKSRGVLDAKSAADAIYEAYRTVKGGVRDVDV